MRLGDQVVAKHAVGGEIAIVPGGTRGVIVCAHPLAGRFEVEFENGRTETCREIDLRDAAPSSRYRGDESLRRA